MSFKSDSTRQHLNLSSLADDIIRQDMFAFGVEKDSTFINEIFENHYPDAIASIARTLSKLSGELDKLFSDVRIDEKIKNKIFTKLVNKKKEDINNIVDSYGKDKTYKT